MSSYLDEYKKWTGSARITEEEREELLSIAGDDDEIKSRFFAPLEFGTAGLRGIMGAGLRRMNVHVVRRTTQAFANLILGEGKKACENGVAISFDCRNHSAEFAREAACVLAGNGIRVLLFDALRPTPELSFAIRHYGCTAGINITASHNPKEYNGYKVYWSDGAQLPPAHADIVAAETEKTDIFDGWKSADYDRAVGTGLIRLLGEETDELFLDRVLAQAVNREAARQAADSLTVVYTPFHGTGYRLVPEALGRLGLKHILCQPDQMRVDGDFPTVKSPNPEEKAGFALAIELAREKGASLIIGTDPDADRVGVVLRDNRGEYVTLSGNQVGVLLLDYLISARKKAGTLPENAAAIKTIVTTEMAREVGEKNGVRVFDTFTGFKFMAELIKRFEDEGSCRYIFAYEESYGYMAGDHARDKDAVTAAVLICEMAAVYHLRGMTLYDAMQALYKKYGYFSEKTLNLLMPGLDGLAKMKEIMGSLRCNPPEQIAGTRVIAIRDYLSGTKTNTQTGQSEAMVLKNSDVLGFALEDGTQLLIRPSGTEPKVKVYILSRGKDAPDCEEKISRYEAFAGRFA